MFYILLFFSVLFLAFSNGGNDNIKGVSTLIGSGTLSYKQALLLSSIATLVGGVAAIFLANSLTKSFSGKGLVDENIIISADFILAVAFGAAITVFLSSKLGMPISTTHALMGGLIGAGFAAPGSVNLNHLGGAFVLPLILSPVIALALSFSGYKLFNFLRKKLNINRVSCVCVGNEFIPIEKSCSGNALCYTETATQLTVSFDSTANCVDRYSGRFIGMEAQNLITIGHVLSGAWVCFARALNDVPKIAGLLLLVDFISPGWGLTSIAACMIIGGLVSSRKIAKTMSNNITPMNQGQGFTANGVTSLTVTFASIFGVPVSTTHVSVGALFGIGAATKQGNMSTVRKIITSWLLTLPIAAMIAGMVYVLVS
jgi:PiT family inorganic phosphate transporter